MSLPGADGTITVQGEAATTVDYGADVLRVDVAYPYYVPGGRYLHGPKTAFHAKLVTPSGNVVDVRERSGSTGYVALPLLVVGLLLTAVGGVSVSLGRNGRATEGGAVVLGTGIVFDTLGFAALVAGRSSNTRILPRR